MAAKMMVRPMSDRKAFAKGIAAAKRLHGKFDGTAKVWMVRADLVQEFAGSDSVQDYLRRNCLILVDAPSADAATTWMGQKSMDAEGSIF